MNCTEGKCKYPTTCKEKSECRTDDDKAVCPHYGLPRIDGAGCPDCNFEEDVEAVIACLGDDAAQLRQENDEDERAENMEKAAKYLEHFMACRRLSYPAADLESLDE